MRSWTAPPRVSAFTALVAGLAIGALAGASPAQAEALPVAQPATVAEATPGATHADGSDGRPAAETRVPLINLGGPVGITTVTVGIGGLVAGLVRRRRRAMVVRSNAEQEHAAQVRGRA